MTTKLSPYLQSTHRDERDFQIWKAWQPRSIRIMEAEWTDNNFVYRLLRELPNTLLVMRAWEQSEQHDKMINDPVGLGISHANAWANQVQARSWPANRMLFSGINEPRVWLPDHRNASISYNVAFLDRCRALGLRAGALNLSVGWPDNTGPDTPVNWTPFAPVYAAIQRGNHMLVLHEYWDYRGPQHEWRWKAGRYLQCPWSVPILIGECGLDQHVGGHPTHQGYRGILTTEQYLSQLAWYDDRLQEDSRIHSAQIFTYDYANNEWFSFDIQAIREQIALYAIGQRDSTPIPGPIPPDPKPGDLGNFMLQKAEEHQVMKLNPSAALQKVILKDGFIPTSEEFQENYAGIDFVGQRAERLTDGAVRVYYCQAGQWDKVYHKER